MAEYTTLTEVYSKGINRLAKVVYIFMYTITMLFLVLIYWGTSEGSKGTIILFGVVAVSFYEFIKRAFYYVLLGTIRPKK